MVRRKPAAAAAAAAPVAQAPLVVQAGEHTESAERPRARAKSGRLPMRATRGGGGHQISVAAARVAEAQRLAVAILRE